MPVCRLRYPARGAAQDVLDAAAQLAGDSGPVRGGGGQPGRGGQGESAGRVEVAEAARGGGRCGEGLSPLLGVREGGHRWRENWQEVMHRG